MDASCVIRHRAVPPFVTLHGGRSTLGCTPRPVVCSRCNAFTDGGGMDVKISSGRFGIVVLVVVLAFAVATWAECLAAEMMRQPLSPPPKPKRRHRESL